MKPTRFAVWLNAALTVVWFGLAAWYVSQDRPWLGGYYAALLAVSTACTVWSERTFRRWRKSHCEHLARMQRYQEIRHAALRRIEEINQGRVN